MRLSIMYFIFLLIISLFPTFAGADTPSSIGVFAETMMEPVSILASFVSTASLIVGSSFLFAGILKYFQYRKNPLMAPISTVIFLFIFGVALVALPLAHTYFYDSPPVPPLVVKHR
jgi:hypothetical protein